ncbi:MAG: hypothetical protein ACK587_04050 [Cyanobacteriota bacterium]
MFRHRRSNESAVDKRHFIGEVLNARPSEQQTPPQLFGELDRVTFTANEIDGLPVVQATPKFLDMWPDSSRQSWR